MKKLIKDITETVLREIISSENLPTLIIINNKVLKRICDVKGGRMHIANIPVIGSKEVGKKEIIIK